MFMKTVNTRLGIFTSELETALKAADTIEASGVISDSISYFF